MCFRNGSDVHTNIPTFFLLPQKQISYIGDDDDDDDDGNSFLYILNK
jgi:hypothetical protein